LFGFFNTFLEFGIGIEFEYLFKKEEGIYGDQIYVNCQTSECFALFSGTILGF